MGDNGEIDEPTLKRRKTIGRRKAACATCSLRKVRCDNERPSCFSCQSTGSQCIYQDEPDGTLSLEKVVDILSGQIGDLAERIDELAGRDNSQNADRTAAGIDHGTLRNERSIEVVSIDLHEALAADWERSSRDFSHIPPHKTTADEVLTWPIFDNAFPANYLIDTHLGYRLSTGGVFDDDTIDGDTILPISHNVAPLDDHRIPFLVDRFLENVHTKNPILDVEQLVRKSREAATKGLRWDGFSCLLFLACALGLVSKPFRSENEALSPQISIEEARHIAGNHDEKAQADHCFVQASRRLGGLRPSILAAQCNFFAGVYLMYTLRPMLSWQYFYQASITYQLYLKMNGRISEDNSVLIQHPFNHPTRSLLTTRLEQRLYWSCFKSEAEFRVELPLPQSEIATYDFPNLFPSPPSPILTETNPLSHLFATATPHNSDSSLPIPHIASTREDEEIKLHAKRLCNEEESWYYYLTECALRRIGNRVINTFFVLDRKHWMSIKQLLSVAIEFESQVSTWEINLPSAMQKYQTNSAIRAPRTASPGGAIAGSVSQELSWATENRLLEMRHWLYQPFLYYLVHARPALPSPNDVRHGSASSSTTSALSNMNQTETNTFWALIERAINCNLTLLDTRSIPHRHHGLWFDLRATICSSLLLIAVIKSGYEELVPGGRDTLARHLFEPDASTTESRMEIADSQQLSSRHIEGKFSRVLRQLEIWSLESADMVRAREVLGILIQQIL